MTRYQYARGERYLDAFTDPDTPTDPRELSDADLLNCLGVNGDANRSIEEATGNDVFKLRSQTPAEWKQLDGVREGMTRKLQALFDLVDMYRNPRKREAQRRALEAILLKRPELDLVLSAAHGDVFNLSETDHRELLAIDGIGPATVSKLFALFELVRRGVEQEEASSTYAA